MAQVKVFSLGGIGAPCCCGGTPVDCTCSPCHLPKSNLTISWVNGALGNGSATLVYAGNCIMWSCCALPGGGAVLFNLVCTGGNIIFTANLYNSSTSCTGTIRQTCASDGGAGALFHLTSFTCSPFTLTYTDPGIGHPFSWDTNCPGFSDEFYTQFQITL